MAYLTLNKRQTQGKLIACTNFKDGSFVNLIKLAKPYKNGTKYAVHETTNNAFCSNGLHKDILDAFKKYNLMIKNQLKEQQIKNAYLSNTEESKTYLKS